MILCIYSKIILSLFIKYTVTPDVEYLITKPMYMTPQLLQIFMSLKRIQCFCKICSYTYTRKI